MSAEQEPKGVSVELLASVDLGAEIPGMDGRRLRMLVEDGVLRSVDVAPQAWVERACAVANRQLTEDEFAVVRPGHEWRATCP